MPSKVNHTCIFIYTLRDLNTLMGTPTLENMRTLTRKEIKGSFG